MRLLRLSRQHVAGGRRFRRGPDHQRAFGDFGGRITASYNATTGVLTLSGAALDSAYQQALETVSFSHSGVVANSSCTVTFTATDDGGASTTTPVETVGVGAYTFTGAGGPGSAGTPS